MVIGYLDLLHAAGQIKWVEEAGLIRPI
jgi:hypothetical protein